jgi:glutamate-1-semialdehyde 2,1-aminomutase
MPDLATFGKIAGGGLPIGLVCGKKEIVDLADPSRKTEKFASIGGGTFSDNPLTMVAGLATVRHLRKNARSIYPRLEAMGKAVRTGVDRGFAEAGVEAHTTGVGSLFLTHFGEKPTNAEEAARGNRKMARSYVLHLMASGVFMLPGHPGAISTAHSSKDTEKLIAHSKSIQWIGRDHP